MTPHTKAKHTILERYLKGWFPIMSKWNQRIVYLDGFAGSGIYNSGDPGSPVLALRVADDHVLHNMMLKGEKVFYFVEKDHRTFNTLKSVLEEQFGPWTSDGKLKGLPQNFKVFVNEGDFNLELEKILNSIEVNGVNLAPTFAFVDPYGYSLDLGLLSRLIVYPKCEVLFTFMVGFLDRFVFAEEHISAIKRTFSIDDTEIEGLRKIEDEGKREEYFGALLVRILKNRLTDPDSLHWLSFRMVDNHKRTLYWLVYFTRSLRGMEVMKDSMFEIGKQGQYMFSDFYFDPTQKSILDYAEGTEMWVLNAAEFLYNKLSGSTKSINSVKKFVTLSSPFIYRARILKELEIKGKIVVDHWKPRRTGNYPDGCTIKFL